MKKKVKYDYLYKEFNVNNTPKKYTINELIELGKKFNKVEIAPPLFDKKIRKWNELLPLITSISVLSQWIN